MKKIILSITIFILLTTITTAITPINDIHLQPGQTQAEVTITTQQAIYNFTEEVTLNNIPTIYGDLTLNVSGKFNPDQTFLGELNGGGTLLKQNYTLTGVVGYHKGFCLFNDVKMFINNSEKVVVNKTTFAIVECDVNGVINFTSEPMYTNSTPFYEVDGIKYSYDQIVNEGEDYFLTINVTPGDHTTLFSFMGVTQTMNFTIFPAPIVEEVIIEEEPPLRNNGGGGSGPSTPIYQRDNLTNTSPVIIDEPLLSIDNEAVTGEPVVEPTEVTSPNVEPVKKDFNWLLVLLLFGGLIIFVIVMAIGWFSLQDHLAHKKSLNRQKSIKPVGVKDE